MTDTAVKGAAKMVSAECEHKEAWFDPVLCTTYCADCDKVLKQVNYCGVEIEYTTAEPIIVSKPMTDTATVVSGKFKGVKWATDKITHLEQQLREIGELPCYEPPEMGHEPMSKSDEGEWVNYYEIKAILEKTNDLI